MKNEPETIIITERQYRNGFYVPGLPTDGRIPVYHMHFTLIEKLGDSVMVYNPQHPKHCPGIQ